MKKLVLPKKEYQAMVVLKARRVEKLLLQRKLLQVLKKLRKQNHLLNQNKQQLQKEEVARVKVPLLLLLLLPPNQLNS